MFDDAIQAVLEGKLIAYPTEAVYGLGCDPTNRQAVEALAKLKHRSLDKGFILIGASWKQLSLFCANIPEDRLSDVKATWPGPETWIFPKSDHAPSWITGTHSSVAVRVTAHPVAKALCEALNSALVSTSANVEGQTPARFAKDINLLFNNQITCIIDGDVDFDAQPTRIRDALTNELIRD